MPDDRWARHASGPRVDAALVERLLPVARLMRQYCRVTVTGLEKVPPGRLLLAANHTGWAGLDFLNLFLTLRDDLKREVHTAVHPNYFRVPGVADVARRLGFFEASVTEATAVLDRGDAVLFFPEGDAGNFKPFWRTYELQPFQAGFARVALAAAAPIVPVCIVGGEEATPTLTRLEFTKALIGIGLPVPLPVLPLPVKWRIAFLDPIPVADYLKKEGAVDADLAEGLRRDVEARMQAALRDEVRKRGHPFW